MSFIIVYITCPSMEVAEGLVRGLLAKKLVACGNIFPISSVYCWGGEVVSDKEVVLLVKTLINFLDLVRDYVVGVHPYELPCIISWEVSANEAYEAWIRSVVG